MQFTPIINGREVKGYLFEIVFSAESYKKALEEEVDKTSDNFIKKETAYKIWNRVHTVLCQILNSSFDEMSDTFGGEESGELKSRYNAAIKRN